MADAAMGDFDLDFLGSEFAGIELKGCSGPLAEVAA